MSPSAFVLLALVGCSLALPQRLFVPVISRSHETDPSGSFRSAYQSGDGASVSEQGYLIRTNDGLDNAVAKQGSFSYTSPEGVPVQISYTADQYGFHPTGNVIPQAPAALPPTF